MAAARAGSVELAFAESAPAWLPRSEQFPSRGVYEPPAGQAYSFHCGIFRFCCRKPPCYASLRVSRNQLPRKNDFYSYEPPSENPPPETGESVYLQLKSGAHLCRFCGCLGPKTCSRCHKAYYCGKAHQTLDRRLGHKQAYAQPDHLNFTTPDHNFLFPEFEIVIETEDEIMPEVVEKGDYSEIIGSVVKQVQDFIH
nr:programmed cell death protein 2-like [Macaca fascicularis]